MCQHGITSIPPLSLSLSLIVMHLYLTRPLLPLSTHVCVTKVSLPLSVIFSLLLSLRLFLPNSSLCLPHYYVYIITLSAFLYLCETKVLSGHFVGEDFVCVCLPACVYLSICVCVW